MRKALLSGSSRLAWVAGVALAMTGMSSTSLAQPAGGADALDAEEIVVTARRREETSIAVPVILSAVGREELERRAIVSLDVLARTIPQVLMGEVGGSNSGGLIAIRGISTGDQNPFADQAVSLNIDGAQIARASPRRLGQMDLAQVEVLKGPQALFFGKNSPAGIISIRTADPTPDFAAKASVGYEINAREWRGEGYVSGPLTENLGARIAVYGSTMRGWVKNLAQAIPPHPAPKHRWRPGTKEYAGRLTLKYDPSDSLGVRFKASYGHMKNRGFTSAEEIYLCPTGSSQFGDPFEDCKLNHTISRGDFGPGPTLAIPEKELGGEGAPFKDGVPYGLSKQFLSSLEINYDVHDDVTLTSLTSYYHNETRFSDNFTRNAIPSIILASANRTRIEELSQELRLATNWDSSLNFLIGTFLQDTKLIYHVRSIRNVGPPAVITRLDSLTQYGKAYSVFGQAKWDLTDELELAGGGRYSFEKKRYRGFRGVFPPAQVVTIPEIEQDVVNPKAKWKNFSPEATLTWRPTSRLTVFGAYKHGFLSGGFNSGSGNFNMSREFDQSKIKGYEGGVKAQIGALRANFGAYNYKLKGMQVSTLIFFPELGTTSQVVNNAGGARIKGVELDFNWRPTQVPGLTVRGALGYNRSRYTEFITTCSPGQTKSLGCNLVASPNGPVPAAPAQTATLQDLRGFQLPYAPAWNANLGANFEHQVGSSWMIGLSGDASYTSSYWGDPTVGFGTRQSGYWLLDATVRLYSPDNGLEFAVIGRNLTDKLYTMKAVANTFSGFGQGTNGPARFGDIYGNMNRGREIMFRVSKTF